MIYWNYWMVTTNNNNNNNNNNTTTTRHDASYADNDVDDGDIINGHASINTDYDGNTVTGHMLLLLTPLS